LDEFILQDFVGWVGIVDHFPLDIVTNDGSAPKSFENADLDFLGAKCDQSVEPSGKAVDAFARQSDDQIGVQINAGLVAEEVKIFFEALIILPALDEDTNLLIKGLDADFELQRAGREAGDDGSQRFRQPVRDHFEVEEMAWLVTLEEKLEDGFAGRK